MADNLLQVRPKSFVGPRIGYLSLPIGKCANGGTCDGCTDFCSANCFGLFGNGIAQHTLDYHMRVYRWSLTVDFVPRVLEELFHHRFWAFRVHGVGDFYNRAYIRKWIRIVKLFPSLPFWAYTRAWRVPGLLDPLLELAALPNFNMFWSTDRDTMAIGPPPAVAGIGVAHWQIYGDPVPDYATLIWWDGRGKPYPGWDKRLCPQRCGDPAKKIKCNRCGRCWKISKGHVRSLSRVKKVESV